MEIALIGSFLLGGGAYLRWKPTREEIWHAVACWAAANRDADMVRTRNRRKYMTEAA